MLRKIRRIIPAIDLYTLICLHLILLGFCVNSDNSCSWKIQVWKVWPQATVLMVVGPFPGEPNERKLGHWGVSALEGGFGILSPITICCFLAPKGWWTLLTHTPFPPYLTLPTLTDCGLKPLKLWAQMNLSALNWLQYFCYHSSKVTNANPVTVVLSLTMSVFNSYLKTLKYRF